MESISLERNGHGISPIARSITPTTDKPPALIECEPHVENQAENRAWLALDRGLGWTGQLPLFLDRQARRDDCVKDGLTVFWAPRFDGRQHIHLTQTQTLAVTPVGHVDNAGS